MHVDRLVADVNVWDKCIFPQMIFVKQRVPLPFSIDWEYTYGHHYNDKCK